QAPHKSWHARWSRRGREDSASVELRSQDSTPMVAPNPRGLRIRAGRGADRLRRGLEVGGEALAYEEPRPMHPRLHRRKTDVECLGDLAARDTFDTLPDQRGPIIR